MTTKSHLTFSDIGFECLVDARFTFSGSLASTVNDKCSTTLGCIKLWLLPVSKSALNVFPLIVTVTLAFRRDFGILRNSQGRDGMWTVAEVTLLFGEGFGGGYLRHILAK